MDKSTTNSTQADPKRRALLMGGSALAAALLAPRMGFAAAEPTNATRIGNITMQGVHFDNNGIRMAGNIYFPAGFDAGSKYAAIISIHPGGGVKEKTAGLYAQKLAGQGFVILAFDAAHQGACGGEPRFLDDPMKRVADIYSAIDYLTSLPYVDAGRIGALGVCAGSGTTIKAGSNERRIKAVATVSGVDVGVATRKGWDGKAPVSSQLEMLEAVARQHTAEAAGAAPVYVPYVSAVGDTTAPRDLQEAADYYLTPRGQPPSSPNKMLLTSLSRLVSFTGFDQADTLLTQPLLVVAGSKAGSLWHSKELYAKAAVPKELFIIEGATHMDLYDGDGAVTAASKLAPFFTRAL